MGGSSVTTGSDIGSDGALIGKSFFVAGAGRGGGGMPPVFGSDDMFPEISGALSSDTIIHTPTQITARIGIAKINFNLFITCSACLFDIPHPNRNIANLSRKERVFESACSL
ncbi:hypothetical protein GCM10008927_11430 [Amylibacter ulvae]|uniref:Uncharacterized protein n=1 Tax=Paramylibacter ulvae TaxID=1651968 RepID=A0ABQ3CZK6_9RHOB|nr:hypothetical protein GCM10008927_11430 [Amylibacter ulvae]